MGRVITLRESELTALIQRIVTEEKRKSDGDCKEITVRSVSDVKRLLGNPKSMKQLVSNYKKLYSGQSNTKGMPTPKEVMDRTKHITDGRPKDPVVAALWWIFGIVIGLMIILCIQW